MGRILSLFLTDQWAESGTLVPVNTLRACSRAARVRSTPTLFPHLGLSLRCKGRQ